MSTHEEIMAVYTDDIGKMSYIVEQKFGKIAFYDGFSGMGVRSMLDADPCAVKEVPKREHRPRKRGK